MSKEFKGYSIGTLLYKYCVVCCHNGNIAISSVIIWFFPKGFTPWSQIHIRMRFQIAFLLLKKQTS